MKVKLPRKFIFMLVVAVVALLPVSRMVRIRQLRTAGSISEGHEAISILQQQLEGLPASEAAALVQRTMLDGADGMRFAAADLCEHYHDNQIADVLVRACEDPYSEVRKRALSVALKLDHKTGYRLLLRAMQDEDTWMRDDAIFMLESLAGTKHPEIDKQAVPVLIGAMSPENDRLLPIISTVLRHITHQPWRCSALDQPTRRAAVRAQWQRWWQSAKPEYAAEIASAPLPLEPGRFLHNLAPQFRVRDTEGETVDLQQLPLKGRVVMLNFWGTWCPPCAGETPVLAALNLAYERSGLTIIGVAGKEANPDSFATWCHLHGLVYRQVINDQAAVPEREFGSIYEVPVTILIDRQGRVRRRWDGERDYRTFDAAVKALLSEKAGSGNPN